MHRPADTLDGAVGLRARLGLGVAVLERGQQSLLVEVNLVDGMVAGRGGLGLWLGVLLGRQVGPRIGLGLEDVALPTALEGHQAPLQVLGVMRLWWLGGRAESLHEHPGGVCVPHPVSERADDEPGDLGPGQRSAPLVGGHQLAQVGLHALDGVEDDRVLLALRGRLGRRGLAGLAETGERGLHLLLRELVQGLGLVDRLVVVVGAQERHRCAFRRLHCATSIVTDRYGVCRANVTRVSAGDPPRPSSRAWTELLHAEVAYLLRTAGIPVLHIKGPTVALWLYEEGERPWGDVDVMVPPSRMHEALAVLSAHGLVERYVGVNRDSTEDHAITLARTDPDLGFDEVDVHDRFPGIDADPERAFESLWRRREPARLAHTDVWFPDHTSRALLIALNTARSHASRKARTDLARMLEASAGVEWDLVVDLARRLDALPALRAGLELDPSGHAVIETSGLADVPVSVEWRLRLADAPRTALRLDELRRMPWRRRSGALGRWLFPPAAVVRMRDPWAAAGRVALACAYARRYRDGMAALPASVRALRRTRRR